MTPRGQGTFEQSVGVGLRRHLGLVHVLSEMSHLTRQVGKTGIGDSGGSRGI